MFIAKKTEDGAMKGKISFYCKSLGATRQGFHNYLKYKNKSWKYQSLADAMLDICNEDECNDTYGRIRILYVSAIFDCFDSAVLGLAMDTNMKATLCEKTLENTYKSHLEIRGCILHSDRGAQVRQEVA